MIKLSVGMVASILAGAIFASPASACEFRVDGDAASVWNAGRYNPFDRGNAFDERSIRIQNTSAQTCDLTVSFSTKGIGRNVMRSTDSSDSLEFNLTERSRGTSLSANSAGRGNNLSTVSLSLSPNESRRLSFGLNIPAGQIVDAARYSQQLSLEVADRRGGRLETMSIAVEAFVPPLASISLAGRVGAKGNRSAFINFGELTTGKVINDSGVAIRTVGTSAYTIRVESANKGYLVRRGDNSDWKIEYQLMLNGRSMFKSGGAGELNLSGKSKQRTVPISFEIGNADDVREGYYSDLITISIAPQT